jgi:hypothetical protein
MILCLGINARVKARRSVLREKSSNVDDNTRVPVSRSLAYGSLAHVGIARHRQASTPKPSLPRSQAGR